MIISGQGIDRIPRKGVDGSIMRNNHRPRGFFQRTQQGPASSWTTGGKHKEHQPVTLFYPTWQTASSASAGLALSTGPSSGDACQPVCGKHHENHHRSPLMGISRPGCHTCSQEYTHSIISDRAEPTEASIISISRPGFGRPDF